MQLYLWSVYCCKLLPNTPKALLRVYTSEVFTAFEVLKDVNNSNHFRLFTTISALNINQSRFRIVLGGIKWISDFNMLSEFTRTREEKRGLVSKY